MIIKTHIKLILNMYNLFSKFYCRERERERDYLCRAWTILLQTYDEWLDTGASKKEHDGKYLALRT